MIFLLSVPRSTRSRIIGGEAGMRPFPWDAQKRPMRTCEQVGGGKLRLPAPGAGRSLSSAEQGEAQGAGDGNGGAGGMRRSGDSQSARGKAPEECGGKAAWASRPCFPGNPRAGCPCHSRLPGGRSSTCLPFAHALRPAPPPRPDEDRDSRPLRPSCRD